MLLLSALVAAAAAMAPGSALPQGTSTPVEAAPAPPAAKPRKEKKICREDRSTGSRMSRRACHTADEWIAIDERKGANLEQFRRGN